MSIFTQIHPVIVHAAKWLGFGNKLGIHNLSEKERVVAGTEFFNDLAFKVGNAIF